MIISSGDFGSRTKYDFVNIQTQHINLHYKLRDIKDLLDDISEQDDEELAEFNITLDNLNLHSISPSPSPSPSILSLNNQHNHTNNFTDIESINNEECKIHFSEISKKYSKISRSDTKHIHGDNLNIEQLIDTYRKFFENMDDQLGMMKNTLETLLKIIDINISEKRNDIARFDIKINIITLGISFATFISSSFGMNLKNHIENVNYSFYVANSIMIATVFIIYIYTNRAFKSMVG